MIKDILDHAFAYFITRGHKKTPHTAALIYLDDVLLWR